MVVEEGSFVVLCATLNPSTSFVSCPEAISCVHIPIKVPSFPPFINPPNLSSGSAQDIGISSLEDAHDGATEEFTAGSTKLNLNGKKKVSKMNIPSKVVRLFRWADPSHTRRYGRWDVEKQLQPPDKADMCVLTLFPAKWWTLHFPSMA